ncbi:hypothetical protein [Tellurirhabdus rosea]|uniref:hypothetical protein n=1 Tax=Tellurirhabdus rosea TaxID=2674997 RepID=UPI0022556846|nr:hypothetical protein [Tellurirhabdus rosea]
MNGNGIQIRFDGQVVDLPKDFKVDIERVSPYLTFEDILSPRTTIPALPATARNRQILGYPDLLQSDNVAFQYECQTYFNGQLINQGIGVITEVAEAGYSFGVVQALGQFFGDYQTELLTEIDLGTVAIPAPLTAVVQQGGRDACCFPAMVNPDFYGSNGGQVGYSWVMNDISGGVYTAEGPKIPMFFVPFVLHRIAQLTGTTIEGDFLTHPVLSKLFIVNTRALDGAASADVARHLPEMSVATFLLELRKMFCLKMDIDTVSKRLRLDFLKDMLARPTRLDWSRKAVKQYRKVPETARRLQLGSDLDSGDALSKDKPPQLDDYLTPELDTPTQIAQMKTRFSALLMDPDVGIPALRQQGITQLFNQGAGKFGARLCLWKGFEENYPVSASTLYGVSLYWKSPDGAPGTGLADVFWRPYIEMRKRQYYASRELVLTETDLAGLDFSEKIHINGVDYLLARVQVSLPIKAPAQCLLVRV